MSLSPENKALLDRLYDFGPPLPAQFVFSREGLDDLMNAVRAQLHPDVARLVEACRPFAEAAKQFRPDDADTMRPAVVQAVHFRRLAVALASFTNSTEEKG